MPVDFVIALGRSEVYRFTTHVTLGYVSLGGFLAFPKELELEVRVVRVFAHLLSPPSWVRVVGVAHKA